MFDFSRRAFASRALRLLVGVALLGLSSCATGRRLVVFHTSDVHGGIEARPAKWHAENPSRLIGGQATLGALIAKETGPTLLLDSGDIYQGTPIGNLTRGAAVVAGMNALGYDAMAIGNHEYDYGEENVAALAKIAQFPFLGANIRRRIDGEPPSYVDRSVLLDVGGVKVGLIGIATRHTATSTLPKNVEALNFEDEVKAASREATLLRERGAEVIIALSHCGLAPSVARKRVEAKDLTLNAADEAYGGDLAIARGADVDLVLGGHLHTGLIGTFRDPVSGKVIVQSYESLEAVSRIEIHVADDGDVEATSELIDLWVDQYGQDPAVKSIVDSFGASIGAELDRVIGTLAEDLRRADGGLDSALGNFFADAIREAGQADVGIQNTFGIRADLYAGKLTQRDIYRVMPFENTLTVVDMPGVALEAFVAESLRDGRARMQFSGLAATVTLTPKNEVFAVSVAVDGRPLERDRVYRVATSNYLTSGGSGGERFKGLAVKDTGLSLRQVLQDALVKQSPVSAPKQGRLKVVVQE